MWAADDGKTAVVGARGHRSERHFRLGRVCDDSCDQAEVFRQSGVTNMLSAALEGYSASLLAYCAQKFGHARVQTCV